MTKERKELREVFCKKCGKPTFTTRPRKDFCSDICRKKHWDKTQITITVIEYECLRELARDFK